MFVLSVRRVRSEINTLPPGESNPGKQARPERILDVLTAIVRPSCLQPWKLLGEINDIMLEWVGARFYTHAISVSENFALFVKHSSTSLLFITADMIGSAEILIWARFITVYNLLEQLACPS